MKVSIIFTTNHPDTLGNACRLEMVHYLTQYFDTTIITNRARFISSRFPECDIIEFNPVSRKWLPIISQNIEWLKLSNIINSLKSDICFMFDDTSAIANYIKIPVIQYVHQFGSRSNQKVNTVKSIYRRFIRYILDKVYFSGLKKSKAVFVVSKPIMDILHSKGVNELSHTPHAINIQKFQKPEITDFHLPLTYLKDNGYFMISYTGWVTENRGFKLMLDSLRRAYEHEERIALVIAGANEEFSKKIEEYKLKHGLEKNIINLGIIDVSLIPGILHLSDVCLSFLDDVPAYRISPPQKIIEYFASGKPVICNNIYTHELLVTHEVNGLVLEYDHREICDAILKLKRNPELLATLSSNALKEADNYDIDLIYGEIVNKIKSVVNEVKC